MAVALVSLRIVDISLERHLHDAFVVSKYALVTVAEIQAPDLDILIS